MGIDIAFSTFVTQRQQYSIGNFRCRCIRLWQGLIRWHCFIHKSLKGGKGTAMNKPCCCKSRVHAVVREVSGMRSAGLSVKSRYAVLLVVVSADTLSCAAAERREAIWLVAGLPAGLHHNPERGPGIRDLPLRRFSGH